MELKDIFKIIEKEIQEEEELYGDALALTFQSYETYALAVKITEGYFRASGIMSSDSFTEKRLRDELIALARVCIKSASMIHTEDEDTEDEDTEETNKRRTIGFKVADKEDGYTEEEPPSYPVDTYAVGYEIDDEEDYYGEEGDYDY